MLKGCQDESEAARALWKQGNIPFEWKELHVSFVEVPMKTENSLKKRPNTADTIKAWLEREPTEKKLLFVSDQPFCGYQFAVVAGSLPESFSFDVVGPGADPSSHPASAAITLDTIARWLYQTEQNQSSEN